MGSRGNVPLDLRKERKSSLKKSLFCKRWRTKVLLVTVNGCEEINCVVGGKQWWSASVGTVCNALGMI